MPATPIATSVVPRRHGRPKESLTITATPSRSLRRAAESSGSSGSKTSVPGSGAFEASTPAAAHTKPCRVSAMTSSPRRRTIRRASLSTSSSFSPRTTRPSAFEITLCDTTSTSPFSKSAASAISAATSSPARISGRPSIGMTRSSLRGGP